MPSPLGVSGDSLAARFLKSRLKTETGSDVQFRTDPEIAHPEGYRLSVHTDGVLIESATELGQLQGAKTLAQWVEGRSAVPCVRIEDLPRFEWRGLHLDVGRHFMPVEDILQLLDRMGDVKLNRFHWHLTEDQGWRIEIKAFPKLTEIGAVRQGTMRTSDKSCLDPAEHSGFYTHDDVRRVIAHAESLGIMVVPEIELPGHATAALAAYPELGNDPSHRPEVGNWWGVYETVFGVHDAVFEFLENVFDEVCSLFPGPYVHIGGDECPKTEWKQSLQAQVVIEEHGLKDEDELQSWFIRRAQAILARHGKILIGWDEILEGGLAKGAIVMSWRGEEGGIAAAKQGNSVIMTPWSHTYFDHYESMWIGDEPQAIGGYTPLRKVYEYEPVPAELTPSEAQLVLGAQGQLWREYMPTTRHVMHRAFPRMLALAEVLWGTKSSYEEFLLRAGINESPAVACKVRPGDELAVGVGRFAIRLDFDAAPEAGIEVKIGGRVLWGPVRIGGATHALWFELETTEPFQGMLQVNAGPVDLSGTMIHAGPVSGRPQWARVPGLPETLELARRKSEG